MALSLKIENETSLPDGGPLSVSVTGKRGIDIGRDQHLDWTLPDPTRHISGKHCEIRYRDGAYWLHDVSTNGTFLYGRDGRLKGPHRLRNGDRLVIGNYVIAVMLDGEEAAPPEPSQPVASGDLWSSAREVAPPVSRAQVMAPTERPAPVRADFLDWAADFPEPQPAEQIRSRPAAPSDLPKVGDEVLDWAHGAPARPPAVAPEPAIPTPRRPLSNEPDRPWRTQPASGSREAGQDPPQIAGQPIASVASAPPRSASVDPAPPTGPTASTDFVQALAHGARLPTDVLGRQPPDHLAEQIGSLLLLIAENMRQLLQARVHAKRLARSAQHTQIEALHNNPLKFSVSAEEALRNMFGPPTRGYLDAHGSFEQGFEDLKTHQITTYTAMQQAINLLVADLDPRTIEAATEADRGVAALVVSRKARLWDAYAARWQALAGRHDGGMLDVFMRYFAECYDRGEKKGS
jgi:type VI secretion system protein ImpI